MTDAWRRDETDVNNGAVTAIHEAAIALLEIKYTYRTHSGYRYNNPMKKGPRKHDAMAGRRSQ